MNLKLRKDENSKIKIYKNYEYNTEPTKLTKQIEEITNYRIRKQNLEDEIKRIKNLMNRIRKKKKRLERYTLGGLNFDAVVIADFDGQKVYQHHFIQTYS